MPELHLLRPGWLAAFLPVALLWWGLWRRSPGRRTWRGVVDAHLLPHLLVDETDGKVPRPLHLLGCLLLLGVVALSGPSWRYEPTPFADDQAGLIVVLRMSGTMNATDVTPSRLRRAKLKLQDLLAARRGAETGLVVYGGSAHLVMPLTGDERVIPTMIEDLTPELMPTSGDALGQALALAARALEQAGVPGSILVITDAVSAQGRAPLTGPVAFPVQFLNVKAPRAPEDTGVQQAAAALEATITPLTPDDADVRQVVRRARTAFRAASQDGVTPRRQDGGYTLVPLLVLLALMWSRRGWVVR
jgi:Ca-activated chloride channel family protein